jgi:hypothetical protein
MKKRYPIFAAFLFPVCFLQAQTTVSFPYTGAMQIFVVPACVTSISVDVSGGAGGGEAALGAPGAYGGSVQADLPVTPGTTLYIFVGGKGDSLGNPGFNGGGAGANGSVGAPGGGGGGGSDIRVGGTTLNDRVIVAGGGGGSCENGGASVGGAGGGLIGGTATCGGNPWGCTPLTNATGGTQSAGGQGGTSSSCAWNGSNGVFGIGGAGYPVYRCAGGGGGWYGGGGGHNGCSGGGGSSYTTPAATNVIHTAGFRNGNGIITLTYSTSLATPAAISGPSSLCEGSTGTYSISAVSGATSYTWAVPSGSTINSGQGTTSITVTAGNISGSVTVYATGTCPNSGTQSLAVTYDALSNSGTVSSSASVICEGSTIDLSGTGTSAGTLMWYEFDGMNYNYLGNGNPYTSPVLFAGSTQFVAMISNGACATDTSAFITVTVDQAPDAGTISSPQMNGNICAFDTVLFATSGSFGSITWWLLDTTNGNWNSFGAGNPYNPGPPSNNAVGAYTFIAVASNGVCAGDTSSLLQLNVRSTPVVNLGNDFTQCGGTVSLDAGNPGNSYLWNNNQNTQLITTGISGTYIVTVTTSYGCMGSDTIQLQVDSLPAVDLGADNSFCGETYLDAGPGGVSYLWSDSSTTQTLLVTSGGNYAVTVTAANGCTNSDTISIIINPVPVVTVSPVSSPVCLDDGTVTLNATPAGGTWSGPGVTGSLFNPMTAGNGTHTLLYTYTDVNGCTDTANVTIAVNPCTGVAENNSSAVNVYPNPTEGVFTLTLDFPAEHVAIVMTDIQGRVVYDGREENTPAGFTKQIAAENLAAGLYLLHVVTEDGEFTVKVSVRE